MPAQPRKTTAAKKSVAPRARKSAAPAIAEGAKTLVIAEKPSVAADIVRALTPLQGTFAKNAEYWEGAQTIVSSAVGHLLTIVPPEGVEPARGKWSFAHLPVIPPRFDLEPLEKTRPRLRALVSLLKRKDVGSVINACDAGREGELIFRLIQQYADSRLPVQRLWLQSMTPDAIRDGFARLRSDEQMRPLADAAHCRSEADWLVGINGTRAMTAFNSREGGFFLTTVGRVQTPTLSLVVEREEKIRAFVPRAYWEIHARFAITGGEYAARWFDEQFKKGEDAELRAERLWQREPAETIAAAVRGQSGEVTEQAKTALQSAPALYDLTSLQRDANTRFGFSAKNTLAIAQALYERHKAITYPRTDSKALPEDYVATVRRALESLAQSKLAEAQHARQALDQGYVRAQDRRIFNNAKVSDHFAIIPTGEVPHTLGEGEQRLYAAICRRFIAAFYPAAEFRVTTRITKISEHAFKSEGRVLVSPGWLAVHGRDAADETAPDQLPPLQSGEPALCRSAEVQSLSTKPPARYTEATLLAAMEGAGKALEDEELREAMKEKGLGTPATRAAIVEGLFTEKYMERDGREIRPLPKAFQLMLLLRGLGTEALVKPELTGEWEQRLARIEHGELSRTEFMQGIEAMTRDLVERAKAHSRDTIPGDYATLTAPCPQCGGVVKENYSRFACQGCDFSFAKTLAGRVIAVEEAEALFSQKSIGPLEGFRNKMGRPFSANLKLSEEPQGQVKVSLDWGQDDAGSEAGIDFSAQEPLGQCPKCGAQVFATANKYVCEKLGGKTCDFSVSRTILRQEIDETQLRKLLTEGKTDLLQGFVSARTHRGFKAFLSYSAKEGKTVFEFEPRDESAAKPARRFWRRKKTA